MEKEYKVHFEHEGKIYEVIRSDGTYIVREHFDDLIELETPIEYFLEANHSEEVIKNLEAAVHLLDQIYQKNLYLNNTYINGGGRK